MSTVSQSAEPVESKRSIPQSERKYADGVIAAVLLSFVEGGAISIEGKSPKEILDEMDAILSRPGFEIGMVTNHTKSILERARSARKIGETEFACLFYGLYFEHKLNDIMVFLSERKALSAKEIDQLLKESSYRAKTTYLLRLLDARPFTDAHVSSIARIMDLRNGFVHYKWKVHNDALEREAEETLKLAERTVAYIRRYERRHLGRPARRTMRKALASASAEH